MMEDREILAAQLANSQEMIALMREFLRGVAIGREPAQTSVPAILPGQGSEAGPAYQTVVGVPGSVDPQEAVRVSHYRRLLTRLTDWTVTEASTGLLGVDFVCPTHGVILITVVLTVDPTVPTFTWNGTDYYDLNAGVALVASQLATLTVPVAKNDVVNCGFTGPTTVGLIEVFFESR